MPVKQDAAWWRDYRERRKVRGVVLDHHANRRRAKGLAPYPRLVLKKLSWYRENDKDFGRDNNLDPDWFMSNIYGRACFHCGSTTRDMGADRIDNTRGHTKDNCRPSCQPCNSSDGARWGYRRRRVSNMAAGLQ